MKQWMKAALFTASLSGFGYLCTDVFDYFWSIDHRIDANAGEIETDKEVEGAHYKEIKDNLQDIRATVHDIDDRLDRQGK